MSKKIFNIKSQNGEIEIKTSGFESVSITQNGKSIYVMPLELESLAKGLLAYKRDHFPEQSKSKSLPIPKTPSIGKRYVAEQKSLHPNAYEKWTEEDDNRLELLYNQGESVEEIAKFLKRNIGAINSRLRKLNIIQ